MLGSAIPRQEVLGYVRKIANHEPWMPLPLFLPKALSFCIGFP